MKLASGFRRRPVIEEIEARILYSADVGLGLVDFATPVPTAEHRIVDANGEFVQSDAKEGQARRQEIVFIDTATPDYQALADDIRAHADADRQVEVVLLDRDTDGIKQISDTLAHRQDVSAVHFIAHGSDAEVELGDSKLNFDTLLKNATQIKQWGQALTSDADLLIYGCNVAQRTDGQALMDALARLTGADVNASEDVTGSYVAGANWDLEYRTGSIETHLAMSTMEQAGWRGTLAIGDAPPSTDGGPTAQSTTASGDQAPTTPSQVTLAAVPLAFQPNVGQADYQADFLARGNGYSVWLSGGDAVLDLRDGGAGNVVRLDVLGKNTDVAAQGENEVQAKTNYLVGSQDQWHQDVANYSAVRYNDIYDGVDLRYYGNQQQLEYDFLVNPGADANNIQLKFEGVQSATVADNGDLVLDLGAGRSISFKAPMAYQDGANGREAVSSSYHIAADGTIGFDLGAYDTSRQLVIDPVLSYSTYLGGTNADVANGVTVDAAGNVYLVGYTTSLAFPTTPGAYNPNDPDLLLSDVFVTKFAPNLGSVLYSTYVGGTNNDYGTAVAVDAAGNAYVTGYTTSTLLNINNFPTVSAYQSTQGGTQDAFLFKLDPTGSTLIYSTYLGGSGSNDIGWAVAVDAAGSAYVTGGASSSDFPTTLGAVDTTYSGGDAFVTKFNAAGNTLIYSTFIGGSSTEVGYSIAVDGAGNAVVVGETSSSNLPTTANAYQTSWGKKTDAFVSKLNAAGSAFMYSTYLGGDKDDYAYAVALDSAGNIYLTGETASGNYPTTTGAFQPNLKATDAFVSILNPSLSGSASLVYSSYLGGSGTEAGLGIGVDASGRVFVAGQSDSSNFPTTAGAYQTARSGGVDAFMIAIDPLGTGTGDLAYGSYFGGAGDDYADNAVYSNGRFYLAGDTTSVSGIATVGSFDTNYNSGTDAFAAVFTVDRAPVLTVTTTALSYIEDAGAIPVDANLTLLDPDSVSLTGATVQITANYLSGEDVLAFNNSNSWGITGTWSASTGTLTLVGSSSAGNYQAALRSITYQNTSQKPSTTTRSVSFVANDGIYSSTAVTRQISVTSVNDAPLDAIPGPQSIDEDTALVFSSASGNPISIVDVDAGNSPIQVTLSASSGKLTLAQITGLTFITGTGSGNQTMTFTGNVTNMNAALNGLRFDPAPDFNGTASLQIVTNDQGNTGTGGSLGGASTIVVNVAAVNDAPSYSLPGPQSTQQNSALMFSSSTGNAISVADVDAGAGTLSMTLIANQGTLTLGSLLGLASVAGNGSGTVVLSGTLAALNSAVNGLLFTPASGYSGPASLQVITDDQGNTGSGLSAVVSGVIAISVSPNVAPLITTSASVLTYTEDSLPTAIDSSLTVVDADSPLLDHAVVRVAANYAQGEDVLGFTNQFGITGVWNGATGTLLLTGSASAADYQTALRSVTYQDLSEDPSGGSLVVSFAVNDGIADGAIATRAINVIAVNDAPVLTAPATQAIDEDTSLVFSAANGNAISIVDVDAGSAQIQVTLAAANGVLSLAQTTGLTFTAGADGAASMTFTGTVSGINAALNGLNFKPGTDYDGAASITVVANDLGNGGTGGAKSAIASIGINITGVNDAPSGVDSAVTMLEDTVYAFTSGDFGFTDSRDSPANNLLALTITSIPGAGTLTLSGTTVTAGQSISAADIAAGKLEFSPVAQANGSAYCSFGFQVRDDGGTANGGVDVDPTVRTMTVDVTAVNDAPTATNLSAAETYTEDTPLNLTDIVVSDVDSANVTAILTLSNVAAGSLSTATSGAVTSTYNAGTGVWTASGALADVNTLLAGVSFTPTLNFNSNFTIATSVSDGVAAPIIGSKAMTGTPVNDAPIGTNNTVTTNEDTAYTFGVVDFGFSDPNDIPANSLLAVTITTLPSAGQLTNNGIAVSAGQSITLADITGGLLVFAPAADANGAGYAGFTFQVQDNGGTANGGVDVDVTPRTMTIDVTSVNDAPIGTNSTVTTNEDSAYTFGVVDFGFSDPNDIPANSLLAVTITTLPSAGQLTNNGIAVSAGQTITLADITGGLLVFAPAADANGAGYAGFTFQVQDNGGTANGGVDVDVTPRSMTIDVTALNDAPQGADNSVNTLENTDYIFGVADFGLTDPNDSPSDALLAVRINSLPGAGTLLDNGVAVTAGQFVSAADIAANLLVFTPTPGTNGVGYANFTFQVQDDGGTANGGVDLDPASHTMTLNVFSVNDAPVGTNNTVTTNEDTAYTFGVVDFGFTDPNDIPANSLSAVVISSLPGAGSLTLSGVAVTSGQSISVANITAGNLKFAPAADANGAGYAGFTFQVQDDGGTASGGVDLDVTPRTMTVNVTAVNDAPVGTNNTVTTNEDTAYTFGTADFGFSDPNDIPANTLGAVRISSLPGAGSLTLSGVAVTSGQTISLASISAGNLRFTPATDANGAGYAGFTFQVQDNGGTANGGVDLDVTPRTMTVNVTAVNDAPTGTNDTVTTNEDTAYTFGTADFGFSDPTDSAANALLAVKITALPTAGALLYAGTLVTSGQSISATDIDLGKLQFVPGLDASGTNYAAFRFQVQDDGGTANGGIDTDLTSRTMSISVQPVNDAPIGADKTVNALEDAPYVFLAADFGLTDPKDSPSNSLLAVEIGTLPASGTLANNGVAVTAGQLVSLTDIAAGKLTFSAVADANGVAYASFTFRVQDDGGTANGGIDLSTSAHTMTIDVAAVNDPPVVAQNSGISLATGGSVVFSNSILGVTDPDNTPAQLRYTLTALPGAGSLRLGGVALAVGGAFTQADINSGQVSYVHTGTTSISTAASFTVTDGSGGSTGSVTLGISVTSPPVVVPPIVIAPPPAPPPAPAPSGGGSGPGPSPAPAPAPSPSGGTSGPTSSAPTSPAGPEAEAAAAAQAIQAAGTANLSIINSSVNTNTRAPQISLAVLLVQDPRLSGVQGIRGGSDGPSTVGGEAFSPIAQTETLSIGFASSSSMQQAASPALSAFKTTLNKTEWVGDLDKMRESIDGHANTTHRIVGSTAMVTGGLSVGYVIWLLRGGLLLTSLLSSLPAWNVVDPLPILANAKRSDEDNEEEVDPLEKLFGRARAAIRGTRAQDEHEVEEAQPDSATASAVEDKPAQPEAATA